MQDAVMLGLAAIMIARGMGREGYAAFRRGARQGLEAGVELMPALCAMTLMTGLVQASGLMAGLSRLAFPLLSMLNLPQEVAPILALRPLSGSGSLTVLQEIFRQCGVDSRAGRAAAVLVGSSETIFYTMTVYLAATDVKRLPWVWPASILSYLAGAWVCGLVV